MTTIILMILLFMILIFPHELGHFIAARIFGVQVNEFSFGMGPAIFKKQGEETLYSIRAFPVGGFCAMEGEDTEEGDDNPRAFNNKPWWQKIIVLLAGAVMNVLIALIIMIIISGVSGVITNTIAKVSPGGPADAAGMLKGDTIVAVEGEETNSWGEVTENLSKDMKEDRDIHLTVDRSGDLKELKMQPVKNEEGRLVIGIEAAVQRSPGLALQNGFKATGEMFKLMGVSIKYLFTSGDAIDQLSGPVGIVKIVSETRSYGVFYYLYLLALISINLAFFNLLPFPALDGGRILFVIIRKITGEAISDRTEAFIHTIGFSLLMFLAIVITVKDIIKW